MISKKMTCDCGCGVVLVDAYKPGWLVLSQPERSEGGSGLKLEGELHFSSLSSLEKWTMKAGIALKGLQQTAQTLTPHGRLSNDNVIGLYV